jgi:triosephosphate isomerase
MKPLIVANWKMNPATLKEAAALFEAIKNGVKGGEAEVVICPPFIYLAALKANGAQDVFFEEKGAHTGEVSPIMLKNLGVEYVILGHSERRKYQGETDEMIAKKLQAVLAVGLKPILCVDKLEQLPVIAPKGLILAYEPLSAIGTGNACPASEAREMRFKIAERIGVSIPVLYGGSVNSANARDYIFEAGFQGLLVGGASLNSQEFIGIVKALSEKHV